jgi:hypothetical protein
MTKPIGFYKDDKGDSRPITPKVSRKGFNATHKITYKHHSKYTKAPGESFSAPGQKLPSRQKWLLSQMCKRLDVDTKEIDSSMSYWENKEEIERLSKVKLHLSQNRKEDNEGREANRRLKEASAEEDADYADYVRSAQANGEVTKAEVEQIQAGRSHKAQAIDESKRAGIAEDNEEWAKHPNRVDLKKVDTPKTRSKKKFKGKKH